MACCTSLNPSSLPRAVRGRKYNQIITPTCDGVVAYDITIQSGTLPPGLSFSQSTGNPAVISGIPRRTGNFTIVLKLSSPECEDVFKTYRISIFSNKKTAGVTPYRINCEATSIGGKPAVCCSSGSWYNPFEWATTVCSFGSR